MSNETAGHAGLTGTTARDRLDPGVNPLREPGTGIGGKAVSTVRDSHPSAGNPASVTQYAGRFTVGSYKKSEAASLGDPAVFTMNAINIADELVKTVCSKQRDYGPDNIQKSPFGAVKGLTVRLYDKVARLANLSEKSKTPENESLRDTFIDIAGYGIIGLMLLDGTFPKEK